MKAFGHTKTLFIQAGKYKWSYKHDFCSDCKTVKNPHKGKGLCTHCFDKKRADGRKGALKRQTWKHYYKTRILMFLEKKERKKRVVNFTPEMHKEYKKQWYQKHREIVILKQKAIKMRERGKPVLKMMVKNKEVYFPFEGIPEKPCNILSEKYREYEKIRTEFDLLSNWYIGQSKNS